MNRAIIFEIGPVAINRLLEIADHAEMPRPRRIGARFQPASGCIGRPEKVRAQLMKYVDMGIELFLLKFVPTVEEVRVIRDEVIQPLRRDIRTAPDKATASA